MSIFHVKFPRTKHEENSLRGVHEAKRRGDTEIDLDMNPDLFRNIYGCHWIDPMIRDGFRDPARKMGRNMHLDKMTPAQVGRLVAGRFFRRYHISRIETLMRECARVGIGARLEPKHPIFLTDAPWQHLAKVADDLGCTVRMYALANLDGVPDFGARCVAAAKRAGIPGKVI